MKKKLVMIFALCAVGVSANVRAEENNEVNENENKFNPIKQQQYPQGIPDVTIDPFKVGDSIVNIHTPQFWYTYLYRDQGTNNNISEPVMMNNICYEVNWLKDDNPSQIDHIDIRYKSGYQSDINGHYMLSLKKPLTKEQKDNQTKKELASIDDTKPQKKCPSPLTRDNLPLKKGERLIFMFFNEYNDFIGSIIYKDSQTIAEENQKIEEEQRKQNEQKQEQQRRQQKLLEDNMLKHIRENDHKTWYQRLGDNIEDTWANVKGWWKG
ncbi:TPA: hypothetical protein TUW49_000680 [Streptococcus equi subsp. zooepidemicus]|uniref:hypothetical protein n=1 Tax=Streptococcus equi TaxID=1336 RepID=UPI0013F67046|nr:hypothetical protein [Streptococcus equi]MCD3409625.1 hypothetical protein [Streptococcus equi subsp. zooepidemicus]MCD3445030.1 hypothetical protein [Streptococcus equi subsp. zooepidemicus]HEL0655411.1 hypothetical protein [Streptococcus equi subsp. zooepidemicus]HEL1172360.1 hypothetical protein [Streptococcus equi subsp. zooepidemicus]